MRSRNIPALILSFLIFAFAFGMSAAAAEVNALETSVTSIMTASADGSLTVDEQWTILAYGGDVSEVVLSMPLTGDSLISDRSSISLNRVSVNRLTIAEGGGSDPSSPSYTVSWTDNHLSINYRLNIPNGEYAVLGINYTVPDAVRSYNGSAWCSAELFCPPTDKFHYRDISISFILPAQVSSDVFKISDNGNLIVSKTTDGVTLSAENLLGTARATLEMPLDLFDQTKLAVIGDSGPGKAFVPVALIVVAVVFVACFALYLLRYKKIFYTYFLKRASSAEFPEVTPDEFNEFLKTQHPAQLLLTLFPEPTNRSDALAVTFLDLYSRGIIQKGRSGFVYAETTGLTNYEMNAVRLFTTDRSKIIADNRRLSAWIDKFNSAIPGPGPFDIFIPSKRRFYARLFALSRTATGFNLVSPGEISDSMLREKRFTVFHLFISLIKENKMRSDGHDVSPKRKLGNDIFRLLRL